MLLLFLQSTQLKPRNAVESPERKKISRQQRFSELKLPIQAALYKLQNSVINYAIARTIVRISSNPV